MDAPSLTHLHLAVNAVASREFSEMDRDNAEEFVRKLMEVARMKPLGPLLWSGAADPRYPGQSFVQMITTSHCSVHFFSGTGEIYFDLYSCKKFEPERVIELLRGHFGIQSWHGILYRRENGGGGEIKEVRG